MVASCNFQRTPDAATLDEKFAAAEKAGADIAKVAVMPAGEQDVLDLLAATGRARETRSVPLISMSMGGIGSLSRIMGWVFGSAATLPSVSAARRPGSCRSTICAPPWRSPASAVNRE